MEAVPILPMHASPPRSRRPAALAGADALLPVLLLLMMMGVGACGPVYRGGPGLQPNLTGSGTATGPASLVIRQRH